MPPDPLKFFLFLNQLQICSAEKNTLEEDVKIMTLFEISRYATEYIFPLLIDSIFGDGLGRCCNL